MDYRIHLRLGLGSGRGKCSECDKRIKKGEVQLVAQGFHTSSRIHLKCFEKERNEFLNMHTINMYLKNKKEKNEVNSK